MLIDLKSTFHKVKFIAISVCSKNVCPLKQNSLDSYFAFCGDIAQWWVKSVAAAFLLVRWLHCHDGNNSHTKRRSYAICLLIRATLLADFEKLWSRNLCAAIKGGHFQFSFIVLVPFFGSYLCQFFKQSGYENIRIYWKVVWVECENQWKACVI